MSNSKKQKAPVDDINNTSQEPNKIKSRTNLKQRFKKNAWLTGDDFETLFESTINSQDDEIKSIGGNIHIGKTEEKKVIIKPSNETEPKVNDTTQTPKIKIINDDANIEISPTLIKTNRALTIQTQQTLKLSSDKKAVEINKIKLGNDPTVQVNAIDGIIQPDPTEIDKKTKQVTPTQVKSIATGAAIKKYAIDSVKGYAASKNESNDQFSVKNLKMGSPQPKIDFGNNQEISKSLGNKAITLSALQLNSNGSTDEPAIEPIITQIKESSDIGHGDDTSLPTVSAITSLISPLIDLIKSKIPPDVDYIVTNTENVDAFKLIFGENRVYDKINKALEKESGTIYVISIDGYWREYVEITKDTKIIFDDSTTLIQPAGNHRNNALIKIEGEESNPVKVKIRGNINGGNQKDLNGEYHLPILGRDKHEYINALTLFFSEPARARGINAKYAQLNFSGNINFCYSPFGQVGGGGVHLDSCQNVELKGDINYCGNGTNSTSKSGGAIYCKDSNLLLIGNINNCLTRGAFASGGGISVLGECNVKIQGNIKMCIAHSTRDQSRGGGVSCSGKIFIKIFGDIVGCISKSSQSAMGGGLFVSGNTTFGDDTPYSIYLFGNISNCLVEGSYNVTGGGIALATVLAKIHGNIIDCVMKNITNSGPVYWGGGGGGVYLRESNLFFTGSIINCIVDFMEKRPSSGGGIYVNTGTIYIVGIINDCISNSPADNGNGGAISNKGDVFFFGNIITNRVVYSQPNRLVVISESGRAFVNGVQI